jgi:selenocysteine lyase/cysteine desulfurase
MNKPSAEIFNELEQSIYNALETYSNVHRGSGHFSMVSTLLFEQAREIVLDYLGLSNRQNTVIFCTPRRAAKIGEKLKDKNYREISSKEIGLPLGVSVLAVDKKALPGGIPLETGGGNARLVSPGQVIWAGAPDKFEAGTPAVINVIAFARALQLMQLYAIETFRNEASEKISAAEILYHDELEGFYGYAMLAELKKTLIGRNVPIPTSEGIRPHINLDYAASTPTFKPVWNAVRQTWRQSRQMQHGIIHEVRTICSGVLGAPLDSYELIFTSNTTEAINLAAESLGRESNQDMEPVVLNTLLEHNSNELPWRMIPSFTLIRIYADGEGFVDLNELESVLSAYNKEGNHGKKRIRLVAMSGASNVLGTCHDLGAISRIVHQYGARLMVDAAQLVAHRKVEIETWGIDYLTFSAHKVYAPFGTGMLVVRKGLLQFSAAEKELIQSSGEENTVGIAALGKSLVLLQRAGFEVIREEEQALTAKALRGLAQINGIRLYGIKDPDSLRFAQKGGVIAFDLKNTFSNALAKALAERGGIGVRYGCHCAHLLIKHLLHVPPLLARFQSVIVSLFPRLNLPGVARVSLGIGTSEEDIDTLIKVLGNIAGNRKTKKEIGSQMKDFAKATIQKVYTQIPLNQSSNL